jgi:ribose 5-phosphate isomerase B
VPDQPRKIAVAADHAGFRLKNRLADELRKQGYEVLDLGTNSEDRVDYPDYGFALAAALAEGKVSRGVAVCGSGIGVSIALNRNPKVRAALCTSEKMAQLARQHNNANVLVLGERITEEAEALRCLDAFLNTEFEGGRHAARVEKLGRC